MIRYQKTEIEKNQLDNFDLKLFFLLGWNMLEITLSSVLFR